MGHQGWPQQAMGALELCEAHEKGSRPPVWPQGALDPWGATRPPWKPKMALGDGLWLIWPWKPKMALETQNGPGNPKWPRGRGSGIPTVLSRIPIRFSHGSLSGDLLVLRFSLRFSYGSPYGSPTVLLRFSYGSRVAKKRKIVDFCTFFADFNVFVRIL